MIVKVTGGGSTLGAVAAHLSYISRRGELEIESDYGDPVMGRDEQKKLLKDWHLNLTAGHYRPQRAGKESSRSVKLVKNIVLSMPAPTPPEKVLAAAKKFAREKFGASHRYALVLHTDQTRPHVHLVVKAEGEHGRRLHIDKQMLREWREDFARAMREYGVEANATRRVVRGHHKRRNSDAMLRAPIGGRAARGWEHVESVAVELARAGTIPDPMRLKLEEERRTVLSRWLVIAKWLGEQGEIGLAGEVRQFARHLPPVFTHREQLTVRFAQSLVESKSSSAPGLRLLDRSDSFAR